MVLISREFFEFGRTLLDMLAGNISRGAVTEYGGNFAKVSLKELDFSDDLWNQFSATVREYVETEILERYHEDVVATHIYDVYQVLCERTNIAYCGAFVDKFKQEEIGRNTAKRKDDLDPLCNHLKIACGGQNKRIKLLKLEDVSNKK